MARYCQKTENLYDQLADIYEAASVVGVSRHFTKYERLVHDSGLDNVTIYPASALKVKRYHVLPTPSLIDLCSSNDESKKYVNETAEGLKYHLKLGMDNLSAKMAASSSDKMVRPSESSSYFTDKYVAPEFFTSAIPISQMMRPK